MFSLFGILHPERMDNKVIWVPFKRRWWRFFSLGLYVHMPTVTALKKKMEIKRWRDSTIKGLNGSKINHTDLLVWRFSRNIIFFFVEKKNLGDKKWIILLVYGKRKRKQILFWMSPNLSKNQRDKFCFWKWRGDIFKSKVYLLSPLSIPFLHGCIEVVFLSTKLPLLTL